MYAIGGIGDVDTVDTVETYDVRDNRWRSSVPLPQPRAGAAAASLGGLLYVAGGEIALGDGNYEFVDSVLAFDPRLRTWQPVASLSAPRERLRLVASGRYLYAIGGRDINGDSVATVERYDPRTNSWRQLPPMHEDRVLPCLVATQVGTEPVLVVVGGIEFNDFQGTRAQGEFGGVPHR